MGGYLREHERPPAFEAADGDSYTVEIMTEGSGQGAEGSWRAYLFFLRWRGREAIGHVESEFLATGESEEDVRSALERLTLHDVKDLLSQLVSP